MRCLLPNVTRRNPGHRRSTRGRPLPIKTRALPIETPRRAHDRPFNPRRAFADDQRTHSRRGDSGTAIRATSSLPSAAAGAGRLPRRHRPPPPRGSHAVGGRGRLGCRSRRGATSGFAPRLIARARGSAMTGSRPSVTARPHALASVATRSRAVAATHTMASAWRRAGAGARPNVPAPTPSGAAARARGAPRRASARRAKRSCVTNPPRPPRVAALSLAGRSARPMLAHRRAWGLRARSRRSFAVRSRATAGPRPRVPTLRPDRRPARAPRPPAHPPAHPRARADRTRVPPTSDPPDPSSPPPLPRDQLDPSTNANIFRRFRRVVLF